MKRYFSLVTLAGFLAGLVILLVFTEAKAQIDFFTFFIPYDADDLGAQFQDQRTDFTLVDGNNADNDAIVVTISISVDRDGTVIYYDHWEDGLEQNLTTPVSDETEIWGDNDATNGIPPGFATDELKSGDVIVLQNAINLPRDPNAILFDGGDKLIAEGGPLAVTLMVWPTTDDIPPIGNPPQPAPGILYADAWELYPTSKWGTDYRIPIGENLGGQRNGFSIVGLNVQAVLDNTQISIDLNGDNIPDLSTTLAQGENYPVISGVQVGTHIVATNPVQIHVFTTDPTENYEARFFTIIPVDQWSNELLAPRSSDGDFWLYNPHPFPLTVNVEMTGMVTDTLVITPFSAAKYPPGQTAMGDPATITTPTGILFSTPLTTDTFYGVAALDPDSTRDWGYSLLPKSASTTQTRVGLGIGNNNKPPGPNPNGTGYESPVYVTALNDTTIFIDYDGEGGAPPLTFPLTRLQEISITKPIIVPNTYDLTGIYIYTTDKTRFLATWGQDRNAGPQLPSIDAGTTIVPFPSLLIHKTLSQAFEDADCSGSITLGDIVDYQLDYYNTSIIPIDQVVIADIFPSELEYVPDSTVLNGVPIQDSINGLPLANPGYTLGQLKERDQGTLNFKAQVKQTTLIANQGVISSTDDSAKSDFSLIFTPISDMSDPIYELKIALIDPADGIVTSGDVITLGVTITNTDVISITNFPLTYLYEPNLLTSVSAVPTPTITSTGVITWGDITTDFGALLPNIPVNLTLRFVVGQIPDGVTSTTNKVLGKDGNFGNGTNLPTCSNEVPIFFTSVITTPTVTPTPSETPSTTPTSTPGTTPTSTPTPNNEDDDDNDGDNTPLPPVTAIPGTTPPPTGGTPIAEANPETNPDSPLPVLLLPETGLKPTTGIFIWTLMALSTLGGVGLWWVYYRRK